MLVHLKQAILDFNAITAPLMYIKDQLASHRTLDQHCCPDSYEIIEKDVESFNCDVLWVTMWLTCWLLWCRLTCFVWWKLPV